MCIVMYQSAVTTLSTAMESLLHCTPGTVGSIEQLTNNDWIRVMQYERMPMKSRTSLLCPVSHPQPLYIRIVNATSQAWAAVGLSQSSISGTWPSRLLIVNYSITIKYTTVLLLHLSINMVITHIYVDVTDPPDSAVPRMPRGDDTTNGLLPTALDCMFNRVGKRLHLAMSASQFAAIP